MGLVYRLLEECWGHREGYVFLPQKHEGRWYEHNGMLWPSDEFGGWAVSASVDQYFSPLVFSKRRRLKECALPTHVLWADLDEANPADCVLRPSAAWKTTQGDFPHWQALWFLQEPRATAMSVLGRLETNQRAYIPADDAAQLSRRIAYAEGADKSGWDVTQVLRLPGTYNHKHNPPQRIELLWAERRYYTVAQVEAAYPSVPEAPRSNGALTPVEREEADKALGMLPMGLQMALERPAGGDRSLEIMKLAEGLTRFGVDTAVALALLERSPLAQSKYGGRRDMRARLLTALSDAFMVVHKEVQR